MDLCHEKNTVIIGNEAGDLLEFDINNGKLIYSLNVKYPIYSLVYTNDYIIFSTRGLSEKIEDSKDDAIGESYGYIYVIDRKNYSILSKEKLLGNIKKIKKINENTLLINGNGSIYISTIPIDKIGSDKKTTINLEFKNWLLNTTEGTLLFNDHIYAVTYGYQLNTYDLSSKQLIDSQFTVDDYPKYLYGASFEDKNLLVVSGRGFISLYDITNTIPELIRTIYI
jgi:hypothetical protein